MALLVLLCLWIGASPWIGDWILKPLVKFAPGLAAPRRFQLSDVIWLMIHLQLVIAFGVQVFNSQVPTGTRVFVLLVFSAPVVAIWAASLHVASRAGITQPLRRGAVILLVIPLGLVVAVLIPVLVAVALDSLGHEFYRTYGPPRWIAPAWALASLLAALLMAAGLRRLASWAVLKSDHATKSA